jgi:hypothetical protein
LNDLAEVVVTPEGIAVDAADTRIGFDRGASRTTVTAPATTTATAAAAIMAPWIRLDSPMPSPKQRRRRAGVQVRPR